MKLYWPVVHGPEENMDMCYSALKGEEGGGAGTNKLKQTGRKSIVKSHHRHLDILNSNVI